MQHTVSSSPVVQPYSVPQISIPQLCSAGVGARSASLSPPVSSCSTGTAASAGSCAASPSSSGEITSETRQQQTNVGGMVALLSSTTQHTASEQTCPQSLSSDETSSREWLYRLVTFPSYFTPCISCTGGSRAPKREQLMTQFDTQYPYNVFCSHCPECKTRSTTLLQVRRSAFKDVVKASDIQRFGADVAGVQQYTLNGSKVIYLNREQTPDKKVGNTSSAPAQCSVDGRAMMDKSSQYCSLKCKMHAEDPGFNAWLDEQDPSVRILAQAAANAPPRPTAASKRTHSGSSDSSAMRAKKLARSSSSSGMAAGAAAGTSAGSGDSAVSAAPAAMSPFQQQSVAPAMQRAASAMPSSMGPAAANHSALLGSAGSARHMHVQGAGRQHSAPSAFLEAAMSDPLLGPSTLKSSTVAGHNAGCLCLDPVELDSSYPSWDSELSTASLVGLDSLDTLSWDDDGDLSDALIECPAGDWWLAGSAAAGQQGGADDSDASLLIPGLECLSGAALIC